MNLFIWGLDQVDAKLDLREALFYIQNDIKNFWQYKGVMFDILSTCNRFELYGYLDNFEILDEFKTKFPQFSAYAYSHTSLDDCSKHMLDLACGLRSSLLGETEIIKQLNLWVAELDVGPLKELWQQTLVQALEIRKKQFGRQESISFAQAVYNDIVERFEYTLPKDVYILGTGMMAQAIAETFLGRSRCHFITGRNKNRARQIAKLYGGRAYYRSELESLLPQVSLLISATAAPHRVLTKENLMSLDSIDLRNLLIYDLAMPRDIDPDLISELDLNVCDLDQLKENFKQRSNNCFYNSYAL